MPAYVDLRTPSSSGRKRRDSIEVIEDDVANAPTRSINTSAEVICNFILFKVSLIKLKQRQISAAPMPSRGTSYDAFMAEIDELEALASDRPATKTPVTVCIVVLILTHR